MKPTKAIIASITKARELIENFDLCKGSYARDANGNEVMTMAPEAVSFCMAGAIARVEKFNVANTDSISINRPDIPKAFLYLFDLDDDFTVLNDMSRTTKQQVLNYLDLCAEEANSELKRK
jgi:hypothetical protein